MGKITKVEYWNRWTDQFGNTGYGTFSFKHMYPWTFAKLLYIRLFYDEMVMEDVEKKEMKNERR